jgi:hypothetical protein
MPWDGAEFFENRTLVKLGQVERLLATEQHWCKGSLRDAGGRRCLVGAIIAVGGRRELMRPVIRAAREVSGKHYWRIEAFNDDPSTTHPDVMRVLRRTRENVLADLTRPRQPLAAKLSALFHNFLPTWPATSKSGACPAPDDDLPPHEFKHAPHGGMTTREVATVS